MIKQISMVISSEYSLVIWKLKPQRFHLIDTDSSPEKNHCKCKHGEQLEPFYTVGAKHYSHVGKQHLGTETDRHSPEILF